jgi:hypothetical protein
VPGRSVRRESRGTLLEPALAPVLGSSGFEAVGPGLAGSKQPVPVSVLSAGTVGSQLVPAAGTLAGSGKPRALLGATRPQY